jgi:excisionase family DNA binding protein
MSTEALFNEIQNLKSLILELSISEREYLNVEQACDYLSISKSSLYKLTSSGSIKHCKPGGKVLMFKKKDLIEFIESGRVETNEDYNLIASQMIKNLNL